MKLRSIALLMLAEVLAMSLWFVSAAILPEMLAAHPMASWRQAALSSGVQLGFVVGAVVSAFTGLPDRLDPRRVFAAAAFGAALCNASLLIWPPGSGAAIAARVATGALLAGVYPVGMKIAVGWGTKDRGFLVGALVGALTLGSALPHLIALGGGADWRLTVAATSLAAALAGGLGLMTALGPHHARAPRFQPEAIMLAWTDRRIRLAFVGYLGHMWELYAMWAWIATALTVSFAATAAPEQLARITTFAAIALGGAVSIGAGKVADTIGKAEVTVIAMSLSGVAAVATALSFGGPVWITIAFVLLWGATIIPDSAQFSALVADAAPPSQAGSLMTLQTALGFALTFATVQLTPIAAALLGWPSVLALLALGPAVGIVAMLRLRRMA